ncbi:hypothetical protein TcCL_ESM09571 [Trypanosoma cruzi]|nr:hypothetical protein TcCL_ESM09571 [Trypanosoma cruzi]
MLSRRRSRPSTWRWRSWGRTTLHWAATAEGSFCREYCLRALTQTQPPRRRLRYQRWGRRPGRGSPQSTANTRPSTTVSNAVEMPVGTTRERQRRRCSAGRRPCDARTPRRCTRSALVPLRHSQASPRPRPCAVAWIQADVGGVPAVLTGGGGPVIRSPLAGQRTAGFAGNSPCGMRPPVSADGNGVHVSQQLRRMPSAREVLIIVLCGQWAAGKRWRRNKLNTPPVPGTKPCKQLPMAESSAHGVKGQFIFQSQGERKHRVWRQQWDRSTCDSDTVTDERVCLPPRECTDAVPTVPQHSRSQRAGTWRSHVSGHHRPGIERAPSCFARTTSSMEKPRRRA